MQFPFSYEKEEYDYKEIIEDYDLTPGVILVTNGAFSSGFEMPEMNLLVISTAEIFEVKAVIVFPALALVGLHGTL